MRYIFSVLFILVSIIGHSQNDDLSNLFFKIPIYESRDSIYKFCTQNNLFKEKSTKHKTTRNGKEINTFYGAAQIIDGTLKDYDIDSAQIQISSGGQRTEGDSTVIFIVPITSYYYFTKKKSAKKYYSQVADQLSKFTNINTSNVKVFKEDKLIGYAKIWFKPNRQINQLSVQYEKDRDKGLFKVIVESFLYE